MTKLLLFPFVDAINFLRGWKQSKKDSEPVTLLLHDAWPSGAFFEKLTLSKSRYLCSCGPWCPIEWGQRSELVLDVHIPFWIFIDYARFCAELVIITAWILPCKHLVKINDPGKNLHFCSESTQQGSEKGDAGHFVHSIIFLHVPNDAHVWNSCCLIRVSLLTHTYYSLSLRCHSLYVKGSLPYSIIDVVYNLKT